MSDFFDKIRRRDFLKAAGALSAGVSAAGLGLFGYQSGRDPATHPGWTTFEGADQDFNRKPWEVDKPTYEKTGPAERMDARTEYLFGRRSKFKQQWNPEKGIESLDPVLQTYYRKYPEKLELDRLFYNEIMPKFKADTKKYKKDFILAKAYSNAINSVRPRLVDAPPEISDFPDQEVEVCKMKSPPSTSKMVKKVAHALGATFVGIARLKPEWVYKYPNPRRGFDPDKPLEVPSHWVYAIVVGTPMSWDLMYANPTYGTSYEAYAISKIAAFRLARFIKELGYAARPHTPPGDYDVMVPPIVVDAGLGEQGRHSVAIVPEVGSNFRPAVITTNIPLEPDKPIDFGVQAFCKTCKICAKNCPSGAIPMGDKEEINGYRRYRINKEKCHNFWHSNLGNSGCRLCIAVCPYSRKANWLHRTARNVSMVDPTGLSHKMLIGLQKRFYPAPDPQDYYMPSLGGKNASYREPPWWLKTENFIKI